MRSSNNNRFPKHEQLALSSTVEVFQFKPSTWSFFILFSIEAVTAATTVFLHSIIRDLVVTFNDSPSAQLLSNSSAAD
jgi:hypothetical protein